MPHLTVTSTVDAATAERILAPRDDIVAERRADGGGNRFELDEGPFVRRARRPAGPTGHPVAVAGGLHRHHGAGSPRPRSDGAHGHQSLNRGAWAAATVVLAIIAAEEMPAGARAYTLSLLS